MENNNYMVPGAIVIAGALIAGGLYLSTSSPDDNPNVNDDPNGITKITVDPITPSDHILGNPDAEIIVFEYSDTECPFCKSFHATMNQIIDEYGKDGNVAWVYRHFPLDTLHKKARKEAEATECAAELGGSDGFWNYTNLLYETTPSNDGLEVSKLPEIAETVGLDRALFEECLSSGLHADTVEAQFQSGIKAGAEGTPYPIIVTKGDGQAYPLKGALPYEQLKLLIDDMLGDQPDDAATDDTNSDETEGEDTVE